MRVRIEFRLRVSLKAPLKAFYEGENRVPIKGFYQGCRRLVSIGFLGTIVTIRTCKE